MKALIKLKEAVIVEGKYDKIKLANFLDTLIIPTNGFSLFKDNELKELISLLAKENGIIIMTDSDNAGNIIRSHIKNFVKEGNIKQVYLPQIKGKEKRKVKPSREGFLGVEGLSEEIIIEALNKSGIQRTNQNAPKMQKSEFYFLGLSGKANSSEFRKKVLTQMGLPNNLTANNLLEYVNLSGRTEELKRVCEECLQDKAKK